MLYRYTSFFFCFASLHFADNAFFFYKLKAANLGIKQVYPHHFSNSICCSLCVSVSLFGNSDSISNFFITIRFFYGDL